MNFAGSLLALGPCQRFLGMFTTVVTSRAVLGLGGNESYPGLFQPYGGFPDHMQVAKRSHCDAGAAAASALAAVEKVFGARAEV